MTATMPIAPPPADGTAAVRPLPPADACPNCGTALGDRFCGHCGQKRPDRDDLTMRAMLGHVADEILSADSKLLVTLRSLCLAPGELARDWFDGKRARWVAPLRLYLMMSALFYFGAYELTQTETNAPMLDTIEKTVRETRVMSPADARANAAAHFEFLSTAASFTGVLTQALFALLFLRSARRTYVEHLVAMFYCTAAVWGFSTIISLGWWWFARGTSPVVPTLIMSLVSLGYLVAGLPRAYRVSWGRAIVVGLGIFVANFFTESILLTLAAFASAFVPA